MSLIKHSFSIALLLLAMQCTLTDSLHAQAASTKSVGQRGLTDDVLSRSELRELINRPAEQHNPLRDQTAPQNRATPTPPQAPARWPGAVQPPAWAPAQTESAPANVRSGQFAPVQIAPAIRRPSAFRNAPSQARPATRQPLAPIHDPRIAAASWQEPEQESPQAQSMLQPQVTVQPQETVQSQPPVQAEAGPELFMGPQPTAEMKQRWKKMEMQVEYSIEKLIAKIGEHRSKLDQTLGIDEQAKTNLIKHLQNAESAVQKATRNLTRKDRLQKQIVEFDQQMESLRQQAKFALVPPAFDGTVSVEQMQIQLRNLQADLDQEKTGLRKIQDRIQQRDNRMSSIPAERLESHSQVTELHERMLAKQASGTGVAEELLSIRAQEFAANSKVQLLDEEAHWYDLAREMLPIQKTIHQRKIQSLEGGINSWNQQIAHRKQSELELQIQQARQAAFDTHPALREVSLETSRLAQLRIDLAEATGKLQNEKLKVEKQQHEIEQQLQRLKNHEETLNAGGNSESSRTLIEVRRNLVPPWETMARVRTLDQELAANRSEQIALRERLDEVSDPQQFMQQRLEITQDETVADTTLVAMAEQAIGSYRKQLVSLVGEHEKVNSLLYDIKSRREETLRNIESTRELIDIYALWIQDAAPFSVDLLNEARGGAIEFFDPQRWQQLGQTAVTNVQQRPWRPTVGLFGLMFAFVVGRRFKA